MKLYLSSYGIGDEPQRLRELFSTNTSVGYIANAGDFSTADPARTREVAARDTAALESLGLTMETLDLRTYFGKKDELKEKLQSLGGVWVRGGNTFILRQAMKLSGFDELLVEELTKRDDFVYGGYSAAGCVLSKTMRCYAIVDNPNETPYEGCKETIWEGLGLIDFAFMPHFDSDHGESAEIDKEIAYCKEHGIPYKAIRDGEVLII